PQGTIPFVEVGDYEPGAIVLSMVPVKLIRQHRVIPLRLDGRKLTLGMVQPRNPSALQDLRSTLSTVDLEVVAIALDDWAAQAARLRLFDGGRGSSRAAATDPNSIQFETVQLDADRERDAAS